MMKQRKEKTKKEIRENIIIQVGGTETGINSKHSKIYHTCTHRAQNKEPKQGKTRIISMFLTISLYVVCRESTKCSRLLTVINLVLKFYLVVSSS